MQVKFPVLMEWNEARRQWDVRWALDKSHMQEYYEHEKVAHMFECHTIKALVDKLELSKEETTLVAITIETRTATRSKNGN